MNNFRIWTWVTRQE